MSQSLTLQEVLQQGGVLDATGLTAADFLEQAQDQGLTALEVSCDRARNRSAVLRAVAKAVDYPEFFGGNLDALCTVVILHWKKTPRPFWVYVKMCMPGPRITSAVLYVSFCTLASILTLNRVRLLLPTPARTRNKPYSQPCKALIAAVSARAAVSVRSTRCPKRIA